MSEDELFKIPEEALKKIKSHKDNREEFTAYPDNILIICPLVSKSPCP